MLPQFLRKPKAIKQIVTPSVGCRYCALWQFKHNERLNAGQGLLSKLSNIIP